jgi:HSP20 family molecular chaperone IbpA
MLRLRKWDLTPFDEMFDELVWNTHSRWFNEKEDHYEFIITLPGEKKEDIKIWVEDSQLKVESKKKVFSITLPSDAGEIKAKLDLGLLVVTIEKTEKNKKIIELQ